jgi:hypothetical protein
LKKKIRELDDSTTVSWIDTGNKRPFILWHLKDVELDLVELAKGYGVNNIKLGDKIEKPNKNK